MSYPYHPFRATIAIERLIDGFVHLNYGESLFVADQIGIKVPQPVIPYGSKIVGSLPGPKDTKAARRVIDDFRGLSPNAAAYVKEKVEFTTPMKPSHRDRYSKTHSTKNRISQRKHYRKTLKYKRK